MFKILQEFIKGQEIEEIEIEAESLEGLLKEYSKLYMKINSWTYDSSRGKVGARLYLWIDLQEEIEDLRKVVWGMAPIWEIALDNHAEEDGDQSYLYNYRNHGYYYDEKGGIIMISLGDSNRADISSAAIYLYYSLLYNKGSFNKLKDIFSPINEGIVKGGFNSAVFNGLEGYYFSSYFVKWLIDFINMAKEIEGFNYKVVEGFELMIQNLDNPFNKKFQK